MLTLAVASGALFASSALLVAALRPVDGTAFVVATYVVACASVVALCEVLSLFDAIGARGLGVGQAILLLAATGLWVARGRPRPPRPPQLHRTDARVLVLAVAVAAATAYELCVAFGTPPNNWDSMRYHLTRAAGWYQRGAVEYFPVHNEIANTFPRNAEIEIVYTLAFVGRDTVAAAPQLLAKLALLATVYGIGRRVGFPGAPAAFAALVFATLPQTALQSVTTQNDLVVASFVAAAVFFLLGGARRELPFAGIALGLALGTKLTAVFALPVLAVAAALVLPRRRLAEAAAWAAGGFALLGAHGYAANLRETGSVLGNARENTTLRADTTSTEPLETLARMAYRFVDLSGLHPPKPLTESIQRVSQKLLLELGMDDAPRKLAEPNTVADHDRSYFGLLGPLLIVPLALVTVALAVRRRVTRARAALALALPVYLAAVAATLSYNDYLGRFLLTPVALTMPLAAAVYRWRPAAAAVAAVGVVSLAAAHAFDSSKPSGLDGTRAVWRMSRADVQALRWPELAPVLHALEGGVPAAARVGFRLDREHWMYPLYGPTLERELTELPRQAPLAAASPLGLRYVVTGGLRVAPSGAWCRVDFSASWSVWVARRTGPGASCPDTLGRR